MVSGDCLVVTAPPLLIFYVIHSNSSQKVFLTVPHFHQQIPSTKYLLGISSFSVIPVDTNDILSRGEGCGSQPSLLSAACVAGSELLRQALGSEVIRVFATSTPFLSFPGRFQAFRSMVLHPKIIPV